MRPPCLLLIACCAAELTMAAVPATPRPAIPDLRPTPPGHASRREHEIALRWHAVLDEALAEAALEYRSVVMLVTTRGCPHCHRLKQTVLQDDDIRNLLGHFSLVEIDAETDPATAALYGVRGVPALLFLTSDGRERGRIEGFIAKDALESTLRSLLDERHIDTAGHTESDLLERLAEEDLNDDAWRDILSGMGHARVRAAVREQFLGKASFPRALLVNFLTDPQLAVRLGAVELLEEMAGDDFGYDPWTPPARNDADDVLKRWRHWAADEPDTETIVYAAMTHEQVHGYLRELVSGQRQRSLRAMRMLVRGGPGIRDALQTFEDEHPDLPDGMRNLIREVRYAVQLPPIGPLDPATVAHRLVFGQQDVRLRTLRDLATEPAATMPILEEHLRSDDALVRETAIETLVTGAGRRAVPLLTEQAERETNIDVLITLIRGLGSIRTRGAVQTMLPFLEHEHEDVVVSALQGIERTKDRIAEEDVIAALGDERWRVRIAALDAVAALRITAAADQLEGLLSDEDPFVRYKAVQSIATVQRQDAAPGLREAFYRDDALKGPVIEALCRIEATLPADFADELDNAPPDVLLNVVDALQKCGRRGARLAAHLAAHADGDIASSALRVLGEHGLDNAQYRGLLLEALQSDAREQVLAALESMNNARDFWKSATVSSVFQDIWAIEISTDNGTAQEDEADETIAGLMDAFLDAPPAETESKPVPAETSEPEGSVEEMFMAFMDVADTPSPSDTEADDADALTAAGRQDLLRMVHDHFHSDDDSVRYPSAMILARTQDSAALSYFMADYDQFTVGQRTDIAHVLENWEHDRVLDLLRRLISDTSSQVRKAAVQSILAGASQASWVDALFDELTRDETPLKPIDVFDWRIRQSLRNSVSARQFRRHAEALLHEPVSDAITTLAIILLDGTWRRGDERLLHPYLDHEHPYIRRAAARALAQNDPRGFAARFADIAGDDSEQVRIVLPLMLAQDSEWTHRLDDTANMRDYFDTRADPWRLLRPEQREALIEHVRDMTGDDARRVQIESYLALLSRHEPIEVERFVHTVRSFSDPSEIGGRISEYLRDHHRRLDDSYAALLPFLDHSNLNQSQKDVIIRHFAQHDAAPVTAAVDTPAFREPSHAASAAQFNEIDTNDADSAESTEPALTAPVRLVYFEEPGCPECEEVNQYLAILRDIFPELVVERHEVFHVRGADLNNRYTSQFEVPPEWAMITPAIFAAGGYIVREDITFDRLTDLIVRSMGMPDEEWYIPPEEKPSAVAMPADETDQQPADPPPVPRTGYLYLAVAALALIGAIPLLRRKYRKRR